MAGRGPQAVATSLGLAAHPIFDPTKDRANLDTSPIDRPDNSLEQEHPGMPATATFPHTPGTTVLHAGLRLGLYVNLIINQSINLYLSQARTHKHTYTHKHTHTHTHSLTLSPETYVTLAQSIAMRKTFSWATERVFISRGAGRVSGQGWQLFV